VAGKLFIRTMHRDQKKQTILASEQCVQEHLTEVSLYIFVTFLAFKINWQSNLNDRNLYIPHYCWHSFCTVPTHNSYEYLSIMADTSDYIAVAFTHNVHSKSVVSYVAESFSLYPYESRYGSWSNCENYEPFHMVTRQQCLHHKIML
jgi:hypothetical protein